MRKLLISLMAAGMLMSAAAQAEDGGFLRGMRNQAERSSQRDDNSDNPTPRSQSVRRGERSNSDRPEHADRTRQEDRSSRAEHVQRIDRARDGGHGAQWIERIQPEDRGAQRIDRIRRRDRDVQQVEPVQGAEPAHRTQDAERRYDGLPGAFRRIGRDMADGLPNDRDSGRDWRRDRDGDRDWRRHRDGDRDWRRGRDGRHRWDRDWRHDRRYDWSSYRNRYRTLFRLGRYYDPYGWSYRRFSIGYGLWPSYYGSSFWLDDPWRYRLPPAYGPYRWIRYYDDALLVNIHTGQVVDVIHNVFW